MTLEPTPALPCDELMKSCLYCRGKDPHGTSGEGPLPSQQLKPAPNSQGIFHCSPWLGRWLTLSANKEAQLQCLLLHYEGMALAHGQSQCIHCTLHQSGTYPCHEEGNAREGGRGGGLRVKRWDIKSPEGRVVGVVHVVL